MNFVLDKITQVASSVDNSQIALIQLFEEKTHRVQSHGGALDANLLSSLMAWISSVKYNIPFVLSSADLVLACQGDSSVSSDLVIKFCAGAPIITSEAEVIGVICVMDYGSREITEEKLKVLKDLADIIAVVLESTKKLRRLSVPKNAGVGGLMPVCYQCKNVRLDEGEWQPLEKFIENELGLKVSHGVCEKCSDALV